MHSRSLGGMAGCIAVDKCGTVAVKFNTAAMSWARVSNDVTDNCVKVYYGIYKDDKFVEKY